MPYFKQHTNNKSTLLHRSIIRLKLLTNRVDIAFTLLILKLINMLRVSVFIFVSNIWKPLGIKEVGIKAAE